MYIHVCTQVTELPSGTELKDDIVSSNILSLTKNNNVLFFIKINFIITFLGFFFNKDKIDQ